MPVLRHLVTTTPWWDTVDVLAVHVAGPLVAADPAPRTTMDAWIGEDDRWIVRTALLHQLRHGRRTDADRLFRHRLLRAGHPDFFVRKAIGWCLREYAETGPEAVRAFVDGARDRLSPLPARKALKNLDRGRRAHGENRSTPPGGYAMLMGMFRYAFLAARPAVAAAPKAAVSLATVLAAAAADAAFAAAAAPIGGARS